MVIHMPEEVKVGPKNHMSCCPICMYVVKNDYSFLNHIIIGHYWSSFSCGKCLEFVVSSRQEMKKHFHNCKDPKKVHKKRRSKGSKVSEVQNSPISSHKSKKGKKDKADKEDRSGVGEKKPGGSPSKSAGTTASEEQAPGTPHCSRHIAGSTSGHHKKLKKHDKQLHKKSE